VLISLRGLPCLPAGVSCRWVRFQSTGVRLHRNPVRPDQTTTVACWDRNW